MRIDNAAIAPSFDSASFRRGIEYERAGRVFSAEIEAPGQVRATVQGSDRRPYDQEIRYEVGNGEVTTRGTCTCPVARNCKHVAAVMLHLVRTGALEPRKEEPDEDAVRADPEVEEWLQELGDQFRGRDSYPPDATFWMFYVIRVKSRQTVVELVNVRRLKEGGWGKEGKVNLSPLYGGTWPKYVLPSDKRLIKSLQRNLTQANYPDATFRLEGREGARLLPEILATGRCVFEDILSPPLRVGEPREANVSWNEAADGTQTATLNAANVHVLPTAPPWYVEPETARCGPFQSDLPAAVMEVLLRAPKIKPEHSDRVRRELARLLPERTDLLPRAHLPPRRAEVEPIPVLILSEKPCRYQAYTYSWRKSSEATERTLPIAKVVFDYDGVRVRGNGEEVRKRNGEQVTIMPRRHRPESAALRRMFDLGWKSAQNAYDWKAPPGHTEDFLLTPVPIDATAALRQRYFRFLRQDVPRLREEGWVVEGDLEVPEVEDVRWQIDLRDIGDDWFGLDLGIVVQGERIDLRPILLDAIRTFALTGSRISEVPDDYEIYHELPDGKVVPLSAGRLRPLISALQELFGSAMEWPDDLAIPRARAAETKALEDIAGIAWKAPERLRKLQQQLRQFDGIAPAPAPKGLCGELRAYQSQGLAWLQFLREYGFSGVLADDMGLGKTVQTLAHLLTEQEAGRLDRPALIVAPTSTLPNWRHEVERFAPSLRLLTLHGTDRKARFAEIPHHDVVLTSYPLLLRDKDVLQAQPFHIVVLDEAQNIKNPGAAVSQAVAKLDARHRLCLSGTPIENNLDELWSLFNFLMPGLLENLTNFRRKFRTPIETQGDEGARARLSRRVRPFMLRRTKEQVATELPPKTEVVERVELAGSQRDLYESLRLAMDSRVRDLIANKGFEKSRIEILDALLKLRQVCCDPRLVKLESARKAQGSAKLERLVEMLQELNEEGRRVLLFSQFTSMLDLIEEALRAKGIAWVRISGDTEDRETPVRRFQAGEVPVFLISLRAGGTGLNLTAADTVIHYDPWWNPAVENQATDRAHRIGQRKSVFVYKLVAAGTVEEKILELQERKATLAGSIFEDGEAAASLTADDLRWIFE